MTTSRANDLGKQMFLAINNNDLAEFTRLINRPDTDLTITDHCDESLKTLLGGEWSYFEGKYGRWEGNTLLNFALSMERVDHALALIECNRTKGKDIGLKKTNTCGIDPIAMTLMINCEYLQYYDAQGHLLPWKEKYSKKKSDEAIEKTRKILSVLLNNQEPRLNDLAEGRRLPVQPRVWVDYFIHCLMAWSQRATDPKNGLILNTKARRGIHYAIYEELEHLTVENTLDIHIKDCEEYVAGHFDFKEMRLDKKAQKEFLAERTKKLPQVKVELENLKVLRSQSRSNSEKMKEFILLLRQDPHLKPILSSVLKWPSPLKNDITLYTYAKNIEELLTDKTINFHNPDNTTPYVFNIIDKLSNRRGPEREMASEFLSSLITPDMHELFDGYRTVKQAWDKFLSLEEKEEKRPIVANHAKSEIKDEPRQGSIAVTSVSERSGLVNEYAFSSQHKYIIMGAVACMSISIAMVSRLLRMDNEEFFQTFHPTKKPDETTMKLVIETLSGCVQTGVDLNKKISTGFFNIFSRKAAEQVETGIKGLASNFGGVQDLVRIERDPVRIKDNASYPSLEEFQKKLLTENEAKVEQDDMAMVATATGHTTSIFSKTNNEGKRYYFLIDSANSFWSGKLEVHDNFSSAAESLTQKWHENKKSEYAEITVYALSDSIRNKMKVKARSDEPQPTELSSSPPPQKPPSPF